MNVCEEHRDTVVVYHANSCPLCTANSDLQDANEKVEDLQSEVDSLKDELEDAKNGS